MKTSDLGGVKRTKMHKMSNNSIYDEVSLLMRAYGDAEANSQIRESVILVEKILIEQLKSILENVMKSTDPNQVPDQVDFENLMFRNKPKLIRFRKYMRNVQKIQCKTEQKSGGNYDINFLNRLSEEMSDDGEQEIYDAEKIRRVYRADRISQILSPQKYEEFNKARSWSSNMKNKMNFLNKLADILQLPKEMQEDPNILEIIQFLTQETIATIVDYSILTRLNSANLSTSPNLVPTNLSNSVHVPEVTSGRGYDGIKPIRPQEIIEAMRRVQQMHNQRKLGSSRIAFLAL